MDSETNEVSGFIGLSAQFDDSLESKCTCLIRDVKIPWALPLFKDFKSGCALECFSVISHGNSGENTQLKQCKNMHRPSVKDAFIRILASYLRYQWLIRSVFETTSTLMHLAIP